MPIKTGRYEAESISCSPSDYLNTCDLNCDKGTLRDYSYNADNHLVLSAIPPLSSVNCACPFANPQTFLYDSTVNGYFLNLTFNKNNLQIVLTNNPDTVSLDLKKNYVNLNGTSIGQCILNLKPIDRDAGLSSPIMSVGAIAGLTVGLGLFAVLIIFIIIRVIKARKIVYISSNNRERKRDRDRSPPYTSNFNT